MREWLEERAETGWISSVLTVIESFRALARYAPDAVSRLPAVLDLIDLISLDPPLRTLAQTARPITVRSLGAIHLTLPKIAWTWFVLVGSLITFAVGWTASRILPAPRTGSATAP